MDELVKERCDLLIENRNIISKAFPFEMSIMNLAAASMYVSQGKSIDVDRIKECEKIVKSKKSVFSHFRGNAKMPLICKMALSEDAEKYFDEVQKAYSILNKGKIGGSEYRVMAAMTIVDHKSEAEYQAIVDRINDIYERMRKQHKILTSDEDIPFAAMLALEDRDLDETFNEIEGIFNQFKNHFSDKNSIQSLSHILAMYEDSGNKKCEKVLNIYNGLKAAKHKYGARYELATLGTLLDVELSTEEIVEKIIELDDYLKANKGFGDAKLGAKTRRMYATQILLIAYGKNDILKDGSTLSSLIATSVALEICMLVCMAGTITVCTNS